MNPARRPDLPPVGQEGGVLRTVLWIVLYVAFVGGAVAYLVWKLPRHDDGPDEKE